MNKQTLINVKCDKYSQNTTPFKHSNLKVLLLQNTITEIYSKPTTVNRAT